MVLPIVTYYSSNGSRKKAIVEKEALDITQCGRVLCAEQNTVQQNEVEREQLGQGAVGQEDKGLSHLKSRPLNKPVLQLQDPRGSSSRSRPCQRHLHR